MCVGAEDIYDKTTMLSYVVPLVIILLITLLTDLYTLCHIKYYKHSSEQFSSHQAEYYSLKDKYKICHTHCNDESIVVQKVDIPLKSTLISCIHFFFFISIFISINNNLYLSSNILTIAWLFFITVKIPMIVLLSTKNNFANIAAARQRNNTLAWNRTQCQKWEIKCALEDRIQNVL